MRILLVDNDNEYSDKLKESISSRDYKVCAVDNSIVGLEAMATQHYDLIICDSSLKIVDGLRLIESARTIDPDIKTMLLVAHSETTEELSALEMRVDAYVEKTKSQEIVIAYIDKLLEMKQVRYAGQSVLESKAEGITVDLKTHTVLCGEEEVDLTPTEFEVLRYFLSNRNIVLSRDEIISEVWSDKEIIHDSRVVDVHVQKLREKLKSYAIITIRGKGYKWSEN